jgi:hypothetical protein
MHPCDECQSEYCFESVKCPECYGTGIFIGIGVEDISEPHFYNLAKPSMLPCRLCGGEKFLVRACPYYPTY